MFAVVVALPVKSNCAALTMPENVEVAVEVAVIYPPINKLPSAIVSLAEGDDEPMPIFPPSTTENTSVPPSKRFKISPTPFCVIVKRVVADEVAIVVVAFVRTNADAS